MQKGPALQFVCYSCQSPVCFSVFHFESQDGKVACPHCALLYDFSDETLQRQIRKFEHLCRQIHASEEILSNAAIGVFIGEREVKIPFKILLTRLNSTLNLQVGERPLTITFRIEPAKDVPLRN